MLFKRNTSTRRLDPRRKGPVEQPLYARMLARPGAWNLWMLVGGFLLAVLLLDVWNSDTSRYRRNQYLPDDIHARVDVKILDPLKLRVAVHDARDTTSATYKINTSLLDEITATLAKAPSQFQAAESLDTLDAELAQKLQLTPLPGWVKALRKQIVQRDTCRKDAAEQAEKARQLQATAKEDELLKTHAAELRAKANTLTKQADKLATEIAPQQAKLDAFDTERAAVTAEWTKLAQSDFRTQLAAHIKTLRSELQGCFFLAAKEVTRQQSRKAINIIVNDGERPAYALNIADMVGLDKTDTLRRRIASATDKARFGAAIRSGVIEYLAKRLLASPLYLPDEEKSKADITLAVKAINDMPPASCFQTYAAGGVLVPASWKGQQAQSDDIKGLTDADLTLIEAEQKAYQSAREDGTLYADTPAAGSLWANALWQDWTRRIGRFVLLALMVIILTMYITFYQSPLLDDLYRAAALMLLLLGCLTAVVMLAGVLQYNIHLALLPMAITAIILAIAFDRRFALSIGMILSLMAAFLLQANLELLFLLIVATFACVFPLGEIRTRSRLSILALHAAGISLLVEWMISLLMRKPTAFAARDSFTAFASVFLAGLLVQAVLPVIERIFNIATGSTLLEWCDASKPLLRHLAMTAPGTYNHSLQLGAMCESAAESIGARGLLARVGAYYHDIGKTSKAHYFTENQVGENAHDRISPSMSLLVIIGHVKDGLELARQYGLPRPLREFIATHHGTGVMRYFYHTAKSHAEAEGLDAPAEAQFRYPGPKPHSREAGILMLADGAESSVRTLSEPTPTSIRTQVHRIITSRLEDGQLDDCALTLREVHQIEESIVKSLCGIYHGRIAYPDEKEKPATNETSGNGNAGGDTAE